MAILLDGMRYRRGQTPLPVDALDSEALDLAMETWEPAGPRAEKLCAEAGAGNEADQPTRSRE